MTGLHRRRKRTTGDNEYANMLTRMLRGYGKRIGADPAASLPHLRDLDQALTDAANLGIYTANKMGGHSVNELAGILGVSKQAIFKRVQLGEQVARDRDQAVRSVRKNLSMTRKAEPKALPKRSTGI